MTPTDAARLCALRHRDTPPLTEPDTRLCRGHTRQLAWRLADITRLWANLQPLIAADRGTPAPRSTRTRAPLRLDILTLLDPHTAADSNPPPAAAQLISWAQLIHAQRRFTAPCDWTVPMALDVLTHNRNWLATHPAIADLDRELRHIHHALRRVCGETPNVIATCQQPHPQHRDSECGGPLIHTPHHPTAAVECANCGDTWSQAACDLALQQLATNQWRHTDTA